MNTEQNNAHYQEEEISLKELILAIWKRKILIISLTLMCALMAGIFSMFILSPIYDTKMNIVINMPDIFDSRYGEYTLPLTTNEEYINLITSNDVISNTMKDMNYTTGEVSVENLKNRITIGKTNSNASTEQNSFSITISANNPNESLQLAEKLYANYINFLDVMTKERMVSYFDNYFNKEINSLHNALDSAKEILKMNQALLSETPQYINTVGGNIEIQSQLNTISDYLVPIDTINPNYIKIENDIISNKQSINSIENSIRLYSRYLEELKDEKEAIDKYYESGRTESLESSLIGVVDSNVYLPSSPVAPTQKTSPSNALNIAIGIVLGGMLGVFIALFLEYWNKN